MEGKINRKENFQFSIFNFHLFIWLLVIGLLVYSRFINLGWGLPYPMHPDEHNMANAIQGLNCEISNFKFQISNCLNLHFYAYGQLPLYLAYFLIWVVRGFMEIGKMGINLEEAVLALRTISAVASVINAIIVIKIIKVIIKKKEYPSWMMWTLVIFSPYTIQFAHFGTTESLLMLFYSLIVYYSLKALDSRLRGNDIFFLSLFSGLALATKVSSAIFLAVPIIVIASEAKQSLSLRSLRRLRLLAMTLSNVFLYIIFTFLFAIIFSPHNLLNWPEFIGALRYESAVAIGAIKVFYTRQFEGTIPVWFQLTKVFPYALGWPLWILGGLGVLGLGWKDKRINLLRFAFLIYFLPTAFLFAKWSRFMAPSFPLILIFSILFLLKLYDWFYHYIWINLKFKIQNSKVQIKIKNFKTFDFLPVFLTFTFLLLTFISILPGISYLSVYQKPDVRFQASEWIYKNIPNNSYILSETANVVDIPIELESYKVHKVYKVISFNFYDLDENSQLQEELKEHLAKADYIFVPSRRIFANLNNRYPLLNKYYTDLFSGKLGFEKVAEFSAGLNDEQAEETWTVFDHPVIRIYKRISNLKSF